MCMSVRWFDDVMRRSFLSFSSGFQLQNILSFFRVCFFSNIHFCGEMKEKRKDTNIF